MRVLALYSDKIVDMIYVPDPKRRFHFACMRVVDNAGSGYVVDGDKVYSLSRSYRTARLVKDEAERVKVLASVAASGEASK